MKGLIFLVIFSLLSGYLTAQEERNTFWLSFTQLEDSLAAHPRPVLLYFQTDWCTYCRKMEAEVFSKPGIAALLSARFYAVKFDAEHPDDVVLGNRVFSNKQLETSRTPLHELTLLFNGGSTTFAPPLILLFDDAFVLRKRVNSYVDSNRLEELLNTGL
ncbi:thioredoxin family protein [Cyclobacterium xiamenense]|uniref:thioredoxin family protein n=1 Tax=Cyclobacterium xiamenense TaxID=1297121 RepID=UPI0012B73382|nr:thioredoxin fold domain-containing protein [Cyclobacterium xiamenense]